MNIKQTSQIFNRTVIVSALGYFVDIYDLLLFGIVRKPSLISIGVESDKILSEGVFLLNMQMFGMLLGGVMWGIWGDKKGRLSVLFGSIFLYSVANIANAFVQDVTTYGVLRFIAGIGLAGELGAAITLVSETMTKESRGYGTAVVAGVGILGAVFGGVIGQMFSWQTAYIIGGVMGLALLMLRISMMESGLFTSTLKSSHIKRGDFLMIFKSSKRFFKYIRCILIGVPIWFVVGILITLSPELAQELGIKEPISAAKAIMFCYAGLAIGDFGSGFLSQLIKSRKKSVGLFLLLTLTFVIAYFKSYEFNSIQFYSICALLGFASGYWAVFMTIASEQFGTNLRSTVTTTVPNFVRGSVPVLTIAFQTLIPQFGILGSASLVGAVSLLVAAVSLYKMEETFGKDLDFMEIT